MSCRVRQVSYDLCVLASEPLLAQLVLLGTVTVMLNTTVDVLAVFLAGRLLKSDAAARVARARLLNRFSGFTMIGLGAYLAVAKRQA